MMLQLGTVVGNDNSQPFQRVMLELTDDELATVEHLQQFGFTSVCPPEGQAVAGFVGGSRSHAVVLATEHPAYRLLGLLPGDAAIYSTSGARVIVRATGAVEVVATGGQPVSITGNVAIAGNVTVTGSITATGDAVAMGKSLGSHTHPETGTTTGVPN